MYSEVLSKTCDILNYPDEFYDNKFVYGFCKLIKQSIKDNILYYRKLLYSDKKYAKIYYEYTEKHDEIEFIFSVIIIMIFKTLDYDSNILKAYARKYSIIKLWHLDDLNRKRIENILLEKLKEFICESILKY